MFPTPDQKAERIAQLLVEEILPTFGVPEAIAIYYQTEEYKLSISGAPIHHSAYWYVFCYTCIGVIISGIKSIKRFIKFSEIFIGF